MGISCLFYQNKLAALASQELPEPLAKRVRHHLSACPSCLCEWTAQERMAARLRSATPSALAPNPFLWERLEAAIQAEATVTAPKPSPHRRLAPLGGLALAGAAIAAVWIVRPAHIIPGPTGMQSVVQVAQGPVSKPAPVQSSPPHASVKTKPAALALALKGEKLSVAPRRVADPFRKQQLSRPESPLLPRIAHLSRRKQRPVFSPPLGEEDLPQPARRNAVAMVEVGMHRVVEESQTAELNRLVAETEQLEPGVAQRAACPPTEATSIAQHTRNLFQ